MTSQERRGRIASLFIAIVIACAITRNSPAMSITFPTLAIGFLAGFGAGLRVGVNNPIAERMMDDGEGGNE